MKRVFALVTAIVLMAFAALPALAEDAAFTFEGYVTEVSEDGFVIEDKDMGEVQLNTDDLTKWDGILAEEPIEVGHYVFVEYDGKLTKSIPPQAHADKVGCYVLNGTAGEILPDGILLTGDEVFGDVLVRMDGSMEHIYAGVPMTVYYNGIMALSMPGQVGAAAVIVPCFEGDVGEKDEDGTGFWLETADGASVHIKLDESTLIGRFDVIDEVAEDADAADAEAEDAPADEEAAPADEEAEDASADESAEQSGDSLANSDWTVDNEIANGYVPMTLDDLQKGDTVKVYWSGEYAGSEGDEALALEVLVEAQ